MHDYTHIRPQTLRIYCVSYAALCGMAFRNEHNHNDERIFTILVIMLFRLTRQTALLHVFHHIRTTSWHGYELLVVLEHAGFHFAHHSNGRVALLYFLLVQAQLTDL